MLTGFACVDGHLREVTGARGPEALPKSGWIDLLDPTPDEAAWVEEATGLKVSSRAELEEIQTSSRLAVENRTLFLSMPLLSKTEEGAPKSSPLGFVVTQDVLITIRFQESRVFNNYIQRMRRDAELDGSAMHVFVGLLEAMVDRLADILEGTRCDLDAISGRIFSDDVIGGQRRREDAQLRATLKQIGRIGDLTSRIRDTLLGVGRIVPFAGQVAEEWIPADVRPRLRSLRRDIASLNDYDAHLNDKIQLLLDTVLGLINIAQANIIKVMTVVSVVGVPPTLVASIYGMNFQHMPELEWTYGYPYSLVLIVISALVPLGWFLRRGWL